MSQEDVLKLLKKNKTKWFSSRELSEKLPHNKNTIQINLKKLRLKGEVHERQLKGISSRGTFNYNIYKYRCGL